MSSAAASRRVVRPGSCTDASFGAVFRYPLLGLSRGPAGRVVPSLGLARRRSWGSDPSQVYSRSRVVAPHHCDGYISSNISVRPGPRAVCASPPPRFIFVGVTGRRLGTSERKRRSAWDEIGIDFWASLPFSVRFRGLLLATDRSCLGLCLLQGFGHAIRAFDRARPRSDHQSPEITSRFRADVYAIPNPLMGLRRPSRQGCG